MALLRPEVSGDSVLACRNTRPGRPILGAEPRAVHSAPGLSRVFRTGSRYAGKFICSPPAWRWAMAIAKRSYIPRTNPGGNFCGHQPDAPRLELVRPTTAKTRPGILRELQGRVRQYYSAPRYIPSLNAANGSKRQQRSERREACLLLLNAILEFTDLASLRCGVPWSP